uniref:E3 ubiquitin-protein ligase HECTD1-like n=2 Tax=Myxine glutinosa TaxID=7769 RepID=UPI00358FB31D
MYLLGLWGGLLGLWDIFSILSLWGLLGLWGILGPHCRLGPRDPLDRQGILGLQSLCSLLALWGLRGDSSGFDSRTDYKQPPGAKRQQTILNGDIEEKVTVTKHVDEEEAASVCRFMCVNVKHVTCDQFTFDFTPPNRASICAPFRARLSTASGNWFRSRRKLTLDSCEVSIFSFLRGIRLIVLMNMDPRTLLTLLQQDDDRTVQRFALERLSIIVVTSDSVERCFYAYPPWIFMPALWFLLCRIFLDEYAPDDVLEITAHAIVCYLDVSADCIQWIVAVDGAVKALCSRLEVVEVNNRKRRDFAEQCVEVLELTCTRQSGAVLKACGDFSWVLAFILNSGYLVHKYTLHSAMFVVSRLCGKMEPHDSRIESCVEALSILFKHEDHQVSDAALRCFVSLADRFMRRGVDPAPLAEHGLTAELVSRLGAAGGLAPGQSSSGTPQPSCGAPPAITSTPGSGFSSQVSTIVRLLSTLFRGSPIVTRDLLRTPLLDAIERAVQGDDRCCLDTMRLVDLLLVLIFEGREALPRCTTSSAHGIPALQRLHSSGERSHRQLIDCIKRKDTDGLIDAIDAGAFDVNFMDDVGETLLIWASSFGTQEMKCIRYFVPSIHIEIHNITHPKQLRLTLAERPLVVLTVRL